MKKTVSLNPILITLIIISVLLFFSVAFKVYQYPILISEGGIIESLSAFGYFLCAAVMIHKGGPEFIKKYHYLVLLIVLFGFRELDFDKIFTTTGILKSRFYLSDMVPLSEKIVGVLFVILLTYILIKIFRTHAKSFAEGLIIKAPLQLGILAVLILFIFCKAIDGLGRKLSKFGLIIDSQTSIYLEVIEEVLELGIPMLILSTFIVYLAKKAEEGALEEI